MSSKPINSSAQIIRLGEVHPGQKAIVNKVVSDDYGSSDVHGQLEDIGFLPGEQVEVLRKGFLGEGPIMVRVGSSTFALRESEARLIEVNLL